MEAQTTLPETTKQNGAANSGIIPAFTPNAELVEAIAEKLEEIAIFDEFQIADHEDYGNAGTRLATIKRAITDVTELRKEATRPLKESAKQIESWFKENALDLFDLAKEHHEKALRAFGAVERARAEEEQKRVEAEAKRAADEQKKKLAEEAQAALAAGNVEKAEAKVTAAENVRVEVPRVPEVVPQSKGLSTRETWRWSCSNFSEVPDHYKVLDKTKLDEIARLQKGSACVPGINFYREDSFVARPAAKKTSGYGE